MLKPVLLFKWCLLLALCSACSNPQPVKNNNNASNVPLDTELKRIKLPPGFSISVYAGNVKNARSMCWGSKGTLFVGSRKGNVYALVDENKDGVAEKMYTIAKGLHSPNGVAFHNGSLFVAEISRVICFDSIESHLDNPPQFRVINDHFPTDEHHGWKYIAFGPDGKLYVPVGAPCNICEPDPNRYACITRMNPDGSDWEVYARGIRNTVGFDWMPGKKDDMWFTDNGRDDMGDNIPPDELNHAPKAGMNFGYPYCHANGIPDPKYGQKKNCSQFTLPEITLGPHVAALGIRFYTGEQFPAEYRNQVFIAEHGSWNRSSKIGYRISLVKMQDGKPVSYTPFAEGWLENGSIFGRPVDILQTPDGSLLVSDDYGDAIYKISYKK